MAYSSLKHFIEALEQKGELLRIKTFVDPVLEIAEITDRISKQNGGGKAILFENTGTDFPVLTNTMGSEKRIAMAFGADYLDQPGDKMKELLLDLAVQPKGFIDKFKQLLKVGGLAKLLPKVINRSGDCQQVVMQNPDLNKLPVLKCWTCDGGRFITLPLVHTKDPISEARNVGMYRMQVFAKDLTAMHWHRHKTGARHYNEFKQQNRIIPVAVALGGDPAYTYAATAPLPDGIDEYILAGYLRNKRVELVKCITQDIEVPKDVDIVIEGYIDPNEELIWEGPFGDHTGFYSLADWYPKFHVTCITHRKDAIYLATIVGVPPQEDAWIAKATERIFLKPIQFTVCPEMLDMDLPVAGVAHNIAIVKINKTYPGQATKVMNAFWGAGQMMFNKIMIIVDKQVDVHNYADVVHAISKNTNIPSDIYFTRGPMDVLDHSSVSFSYGGKIGIDATTKTIEENLSGFKNNELFILTENIDQHVKILEDIENIQVNVDLLKQNLPIVFVFISDDKNVQIEEIAVKIKNTISQDIHYVAFFNNEIDNQNIFDLVWLLGNNIDPSRDLKVINQNCLLIDATRKNTSNHKFDRLWPNIVASDSDTINKVDVKWASLQIGALIESPSLKYKKYQSGNEAIYN